MASTAKLRVIQNAAPANLRDEYVRIARVALRAYKREQRLSAERLAQEFGYSPDSAERWLSGQCRVPGDVVVALVVKRFGQAAVDQLIHALTEKDAA